jgi:hypothetical protein
MRPVFATATFRGPRGGRVTWPCAGVFFGAVHSRAKWPETAPAVGGAGRRVTGRGGGRAFGADAEVGGEPTAAGAGVEVDRWGRGGTPSGTSEEHYWMERPQPSSSWFPCGCGLHHPRS